MTFDRWAERVLYGLGSSPTRERLRFLHAWAECEGGTAEFNPLNTTLGAHGATDYNSAGVKNFPNADTGTAATLMTLSLPYYDVIRESLRVRGLAAHSIARRSARAIKTWGTDPACVERATLR